MGAGIRREARRGYAAPRAEKEMSEQTRPKAAETKPRSSRLGSRRPPRRPRPASGPACARVRTTSAHARLRIEHTFGTVATPWGTRSCTATRTSRSSTARAIPRSWPRKRRGSGSPALARHRPRRLLRRGPLRARRRARSGCPTVFGAELTLGLDAARRTAIADPEGEHLVVLAAGPGGLRRAWPRAISEAQLAGEKGAPRTSLDALADAHARRCTSTEPSARNDHWFVLTGCRKGTVPAALVRDGPAAAERALDELVDAFGRDRVLVELWDHGDPLDRHRNDALARGRGRAPASRWSPPTTCTTPRPRAARSPPRSPRCGPAARSTRSTAGCPAAPFAHLRSAAEQARRFARWPGRGRAHGRASRRACAFDLQLAAPEPARLPVPARSHRDDAGCASSSARGAAVCYPPTHPQHDAGDAPDRLRARRDRAARLPRLLPVAARHRRVLPPLTTSTARAGGARRTARSVTRSASPRPTRSRSACCSSGSSRPSATARPTSTSTSSTSAARR